MSGFDDVNVLRKILNVIPSITKPVKVQTVQKWRDDFNGSSLSLVNWETPTLGSGQSVNVSDSELTLRAGVIANAQAKIRSKVKFNLPCRVFFIYRLSQRIANNNFYLEIVDSTEQNYVRYLLNGTSPTTSTIELANNGVIGTTGGMVMLSSSNYSIFEIDIGIEEARFSTKSVDALATRNNTLVRHRKLPDPSKDYFIQIRGLNGSTPASNSDLILDSITIQSYEQINADISASRGAITPNESLPVVTSSANSSISVSDAGGFLTFTTNNLGANASFTSGNIAASGRNIAGVVVRTDQTGTLVFEQSPDGISWFEFASRNCVNGINQFEFSLTLFQYRVRYVNGANATTFFGIYSRMRLG